VIFKEVSDETLLKKLNCFEAAMNKIANQQPPNVQQAVGLKTLSNVP